MKLGIIGCGNMGGAIARGLLSKKFLPFNSIYASDKEAGRTKELHRKFGIRVVTGEEIAKKCDIIIIAVKPQDSRKVLSLVSAGLDGTEHLISIMAGITVAKIESVIGKKVAVTRAMPNMAASVGKSITCLAHNKHVKNKSVAHKIFSSIGDVLEIDEKHMNAVTAVSGSGPAYFFYLSEILRDAAIKLGIKKEQAIKLANSTLIGSGALLDELNLAPEVLRGYITSKRGTTEAALRILKSKAFRNLTVNAVKAAAKRAKKLSEGA